MRTLPAIILFATLVPLLACGPGRTAAATQPTGPRLFDAKSSDAKAIAVADQVLAAVGGPAAWAKAKEIRWHHVILLDGKATLEADHAWDRWNGRHQFVKKQGDGSAKAMYELYSDTAAAFIIHEGDKEEAATSVDKARLVAEARQRWTEDSYALFLPMKLKDPGVHLTWVEERPAPSSDAPKLDVIKLTFDPGVGPSPGDVYYLVVDKETHLPDTLELVQAGKADNQRIGYKWSDWVEAGGLKFATLRQNIGYQGEQVKMSNIRVSESPEEELYVPEVKF